MEDDNPRAVPLRSLHSAILGIQPLQALHPLAHTWSAPAARERLDYRHQTILNDTMN